MEARGTVWSDFSFVVASGYREKVLASLASKPKLPMHLAEETNLRIAHVSRALRELSDRGLVACLTPEVKARGRLYGLTDTGSELLSAMNASKGHYTVPATAARAAPPAFVPKIRASTVLRFLEYLRKSRGERAVGNATRTWSVDPRGLTEDTWLSVESAAEFLDLVERAFGDGSYGFVRRLFSEAIATFPTVREQLAKAVPLGVLAQRAPIVYAKEWNYGRIEVESARRTATFRHYDWMPTPAMCAMFHGIYEGVLRSRDVAGKVTKTRCVRTGSDHCEYIVEW